MEALMKVLEVFGYGLIGYFMSTIFHEMGHVVCGLIHKWKFLMLVVGPFKFYREDKNSKIRFGIEKNVSLWGGCGGTFPEKVDDEAIKVFAKILIAGPIASLILGAVGVVCFIFTKSDLVMMITLIAFAEGIACGLPMNIKSGILFNDGSRFKRIVKGGKENLEEKAILSITFNEFLNGSDGGYDAEMVNVLRNAEDESFRYTGLCYAFENAKRHGDEAEMDSIRRKAELIKSRVSKYIVSSYSME